MACYPPPPTGDPVLARSAPIQYGPAISAFLQSIPAQLARADDKSSVVEADKYLAAAAAHNVRDDARHKKLPWALALILRLEHWGKWTQSHELASALHGTCPDLPVASVPSDVREWEWTTAVVRCQLRYNVEFYDTVSEALCRGDVFFFDSRGALVEAAACRLFSPFKFSLDDEERIEGPPERDSTREKQQKSNTLAKSKDPVFEAAIAEEFEALTTAGTLRGGDEIDVYCGDRWRRAVVQSRTRSAVDVRLVGKLPRTSVVNCDILRRRIPNEQLRIASCKPETPVRKPQPGERDLHRLWHESWGKKLLGRKMEMKRLASEHKRRRDARKPQWDTSSRHPSAAPIRRRPRNKVIEYSEFFLDTLDSAEPTSYRVVDVCLALERTRTELRLAIERAAPSCKCPKSRATVVALLAPNQRPCAVQDAMLDVIEIIGGGRQRDNEHEKNFVWMGQDMLAKYVRSSLNFLDCTVCRRVLGPDFPLRGNPLLLPVALDRTNFPYGRDDVDVLATFQQPSHWPSMGGLDRRFRLRRAAHIILDAEDRAVGNGA